MKNRERSLGTVLEDLTESGVNLSELGREIGLDYRTLNNYKAKGVLYGDTRRIARTLRSRGRELLRFKTGRVAIDVLCSRAFIKQAAIARQMGISKQALNQLREDLPEARRKQLEGIVHRVGDVYVALAERIEKSRD